MQSVPSIVPERRIMAPQNRDIQQQHLLACERLTSMPAVIPGSVMKESGS